MFLVLSIFLANLELRFTVECLSKVPRIDLRQEMFGLIRMLDIIHPEPIATVNTYRNYYDLKIFRDVQAYKLRFC